MEFQYTSVPSTDGIHTVYYRPLVQIRLYRGPASIPLLAHIDSGADITVFNYKFAKVLYIDWQSGIKTTAMGIDGKSSPAYLHDLEIQVEGLPGGKIKSRVAFADIKNVGALLGQYGFFEHFYVSFNLKNKTFDIDII